MAQLEKVLAQAHIKILAELRFYFVFSSLSAFPIFITLEAGFEELAEKFVLGTKTDDRCAVDVNLELKSSVTLLASLVLSLSLEGIDGGCGGIRFGSIKLFRLFFSG